MFHSYKPSFWGIPHFKDPPYALLRQYHSTWDDPNWLAGEHVRLDFFHGNTCPCFLVRTQTQLPKDDERADISKKQSRKQTIVAKGTAYIPFKSIPVGEMGLPP